MRQEPLTLAETEPWPCVVVRLYADGSGPFSNSLQQKWMYIGLLAIPEASHSEALRMLQEDRDKSGYRREVHFSELRRNSQARCYGEKTHLATLWVDRLLWDDRKIFHFHLLGIELTKLQARAFGTGREYERNAYNRFFRSSVRYVLKSFFPDQPVFISGVYHDRDRMEHHALFDWHLVWRLERDESSLAFLTNRICFIDSDHAKEAEYPEESHFIQLCDVLLGGFVQCLDARNDKEGCCEVGERLLPLLERLTDRNGCRNTNSRFRHVGRVAVSFFPSRKLTLKELEDPRARARSGFYVSRPLLLHDKLTGQLRLL